MSDDSAELSYDCGEWAGETRRLFAGMLDSAGIAQAWQGPTLTIREADEARVDELIEEVLSTASRALPVDADKVVYDTTEWSVALQTDVATALAEDDLPYEWDEKGNLAVLADDEEAVSLVLDQVVADDDDLISSDDGVALHDLLGTVFTSSSKLVKKPRDAASIVSVVESAELLERLAVPFGFDAHQWKVLVEAITDLVTVIDVDEVPDEEISQAATLTRDTVRAYV